MAGNDADKRTTFAGKKMLSYSDAHALALTAIEGELTFQRDLAAAWQHKNHPVIAEELLLLETYVAAARVAWVTTKGDEAALNELRKVAAIAVRAMINHGAVHR